MVELEGLRLDHSVAVVNYFIVRAEQSYCERGSSFASLFQV